MAERILIEILAADDGRVRIVDSSDVGDRSAASRADSFAGRVVHRIIVTNRAVATKILMRTRRALGGGGALSEWFRVDVDVARRALIDAVLMEHQSDGPTVVVDGKTEIRLSEHASRRVRKVAALLDVSESEVVNWLVIAYSSQLLPKKQAIKFNPSNVKDVAEKLLATLKAHKTSTLPRPILARKRDFSQISEEVLDAAIAELKERREIVENAKSLRLNLKA